MAHTATWPLVWYAQGPIWRRESMAGRIVAWSTRCDGGWKLRPTDGDMTEVERMYSGPSWTFALTSNGRVLIDNPDQLPRGSRSGPEAPPDL
ncbi:hypothetical protein [Actibacterium sp. 188UL27-1]|uniref:hypothetical protein n=1 Tax=Actibacterium sp. 188UL27-1 TaxID=2786961 RepID=UPI001957C699|nr:hypothetical protein [Actibacterium sp. 188UL27-1]MBM7069151.1 hypothetical protein [Actibacterium sp. 188UL27-1]